MNRFRFGARAEAAGREDIEKSAGNVPLQQEESRHQPGPTSLHNDDGEKLPSSDRNGRSNVGIESKPPLMEKSATLDSSSSPDAQASSMEPPALDERPSAPKTFSQSFKSRMARFGTHFKAAMMHSYINILLVFVPIGIAAEFAKLNPAIIFAMNAIAIIPLAGLLTHATESVAMRLGDTLGALLNVSFGNAVELIIFIIALAKNEIRIVQASILGSILANLLLILGMAFLFGGLRFREQLYNNVVTQMSACLLSLSVISLLLPTAFHASFNTTALADSKTLQVSRGTSVILLIVYIIYLCFQLKSHAHLYQSTPQEQIDEESRPGILADVFDTSSDSSTASDDTDTTSGSHSTVKRRFKRAFRNRRRRKSSSISDGVPSVQSHLSSPAPELADRPEPVRQTGAMAVIMSGDEGDTEGHAGFQGISKIRDFEAGAFSSKSPERESSPEAPTERKRRKHKHKKRKARKATDEAKFQTMEQHVEEPHVNFADESYDNPGPSLTTVQTSASSKGRFRRPGLPKLLSQNVFVDPLPSQQRPKLSKASSLPDLNRAHVIPGRGLRAMRVKVPPVKPKPVDDSSDDEDETVPMSRTAAVVMLLVSTGLVAMCAEFLVDAIPKMTAQSSVSNEFIALIILPIVGNAAEHVTAVTVAMKNKMDLAIGVAVGSSIQIALFVTPLVVILGWCMNHDMSLYFTLFETICLFATVFVVNFLVLDGKSNYLEGTLLIASYILITVCTIFFPNTSDQSSLGGSETNANSTVSRMM